MQKSIVVSGKTVEEAVAKALAQLDLTRDDVSVEILERGKSGFFGIGASDAVVRVNYEGPDAAPEPKAPPAPKPQAAAKTSAKPASKPQPAVKAPAPSAPRAAKAEGGQAGQAGQVEAFLRGLLENMGVQAELEITSREGGGLDVNLSGDDIGAVIGRRGETLDAIQHLTNYAVNRGSERRGHINVDAENYRAKREDSLVHLAQKMAAKVIKYRRSMALEPMNSYERHIIHTALQEYEGVTTSSTGTEPNRRVVVNYVRSEKSEQKTECPEKTERPVKQERPAAPAAEPEPPEPEMPEQQKAGDDEYKEWC